MDGEEGSLEWASRLKNKPTISPSNKQVELHGLGDISVGHVDINDLPAGHSEVLILDDQLVDGSQNASDTLVSITRREDEKAKKWIAEREKKRHYNPYEEEELLEVMSVPKNKSILSKYDVEEEQSKVSISELLSTKVNTNNSVIHEESESISLVKKRNVRRKVTIFDDEPKPLENVLNSKEGDIARLDLDDEDLQLSLMRNRKQFIANTPPVLQDTSSFVQEVEMKASGKVFPQTTDFLSSMVPTTVVVEEKDIPIDSPLEKTDFVPTLSRMEDLKTVKDVVFEKEPLVRRGVASTLAFLAKLGIRPQLTTEKEPPTQRKAFSRFSEIKITHYDDAGQEMTPKEAYKVLSHKFHGKAPGKAKIEKIAKKREERERIQAANLGDTPLGIAAAQRERLKATGSSHIVLSHGRQAGDDKQTIRMETPKTVGNSKTPKAPEKKRKIFGML